jgi:hypothetical protein
MMAYEFGAASPPRAYQPAHHRMPRGGCCRVNGHVITPVNFREAAIPAAPPESVDRLGLVYRPTGHRGTTRSIEAIAAAGQLDGSQQEHQIHQQVWPEGGLSRCAHRRGQHQN